MNNLGNAFDASIGTITTNGTLPQVIPAATFTNGNTVQNLIINNSTGVSLGGDIAVSNLFTLSNGVLKAAGNNLIIANNATTAGASITRYVDGNVRKIGNQAFSFPVGNLNVYAPISMSAPTNAIDHFTASYAFVNPNNNSYLTTSLGAGLNRVSVQEYWLLNRTNGTSNVDVTLSFDFPRSGGITTIADLRVASWNGTQWTNQGNTGTTGNASNGTVKSNAALGVFGPFTLGSSTASNSLPLSLISFTAQPQNNHITLTWQTANEINVSNYAIQRGTDATSFHTVGKMDAKTGGNYTYMDDVSNINAPTVFYRLQIMDKDGSFSYSKTIAVQFKNAGTQLSIFPNPVKETLFVQFFAAQAGKFTMQVADMEGRVLQQQEFAATVGSTSLSLNAASLARGTYVLLIRSNGQLEQKQFVKY